MLLWMKLDFFSIIEWISKYPHNHCLISDTIVCHDNGSIVIKLIVFRFNWMTHRILFIQGAVVVVILWSLD
jgi:hypothetical protein